VTFFNATFFDDLPISDLCAAETHRFSSQVQAVQLIRPGEEPDRVPVNRPELKHDHHGFKGQWNVAILAAFASANVHAMVLGVDITNLQVERFGQAKAQRIGDEYEDPISRLAGLEGELTNLCHTLYSWKRLDFGCFDDIYPLPIAL